MLITSICLRYKQAALGLRAAGNSNSTLTVCLPFWVATGIVDQRARIDPTSSALQVHGPSHLASVFFTEKSRGQFILAPHHVNLNSSRPFYVYIYIYLSIHHLCYFLCYTQGAVPLRVATTDTLTVCVPCWVTPGTCATRGRLPSSQIKVHTPSHLVP